MTQQIHFKLFFENGSSISASCPVPETMRMTYLFNGINFFKESQRPYLVSVNSLDRGAAFLPESMMLIPSASGLSFLDLNGRAFNFPASSSRNPIRLYVFEEEFDYKQAPAVVVSDADSKYRYTGSIGIYLLFGSSPDSITQTAYFRTSIDKWKADVLERATSTGELQYFDTASGQFISVGFGDATTASHQILTQGRTLSTAKSFMTFLVRNATFGENLNELTAESEFWIDFKGTDNILIPFEEFVNFVAVLNADEVFAKFFHLPQSSGTGKTRLCLELLTRRARRGAYFVFRSGPSSGFPVSTAWGTWLLDMFKRTTSDEAAVLLCVRFLYHMVKEFRLHGPGDLTERMFTGLAKEEADRVVNQLGARRQLSGSECKAEIKRICLHSPFLIVFDECQELLVTPSARPGISLYRALRRALVFLRECRLVAVFLGTKSSLDDFVFNWKLDASLRTALPGAMIPPYSFTNTVDVQLTRPFLLNYESLKYDNGAINPELLDNLSRLCGRPLWSSYPDYAQALAIAESKLKYLNVEDPSGTLLQLTNLIIRSGLQICPPDELSHKLVLKGMAHLKCVDVSGTRCLVDYMPEPVLSNAARRLMAKDTAFFIGLKELVRLEHLGIFYNTGDAGELAARILMLRAMDRCLLSVPSDLRSCAITTLKEYLHQLTGLSEEQLQQFGISPELMNGLVTANQVIQLNNLHVKIDQAFLMNGFARSCSFAMYKNAPGIDDIIPVLRTDNRMGCVVIQTKNLNESFPSSSMASYCSKMTKDYLHFLDLGDAGDFSALPDRDDFVRILIQFGASRPSPSNIRWARIPGSRRKTLCLNGLHALGHLVSLQDTTTTAQKSEIFGLLQDIVAGNWEFVRGIDFNAIFKTTRLQSTEDGARTLLMYSNPFDNLGMVDLQYRRHYSQLNTPFFDILNRSELLETAFSHRKRFTITTNPDTVDEINSARAETFPPSPDDENASADAAQPATRPRSGKGKVFRTPGAIDESSFEEDSPLALRTGQSRTRSSLNTPRITTPRSAGRQISTTRPNTRRQSGRPRSARRQSGR